MVTEDYVSFEVAKLLNEKGFDVSCLSTYDINNGKQYFHTSYIMCATRINAPTHQMAIKWLVRKYRLYVNVVPSVEGYYWTERWHSYVEDLNKMYPFGQFIGTFNSPEEAAEAAIKYCLENLV